jgi:prolyl-tRNA editing enzyme YbaK/EbsC (Cys-tRNA(Pro) deacylase)
MGYDLVRIQLAIGGGPGGDLLALSLTPLSASARADRAAPAPADGPVARAGATKSATQLRLEQEAARCGLRGLVFTRVHGSYYDQPLEFRRDALGAAGVEYLCKSIIMENTRFEAPTPLTPVVDGRIKYVLVIVQYTHKLHRERLIDAVRALEGDKAQGVPKSKYNLRLVEGTVSDALSGFEHNAVSPLGLRTPMPILIHAEILQLPRQHFWLGGGEVDVKLRFDTAAFVDHFKPLSAHICVAA